MAWHWRVWRYASQKLILRVYISCSAHYFLRQVVSLNLKITDLAKLAVQRAPKIPVSLLHTTPSAGIKGMQRHAQVLYKFEGPESRSSCLLSKQFTDWAISQSPVFNNRILNIIMAKCMFLTIITESWEIIILGKHYTAALESPHNRWTHNWGRSCHPNQLHLASVNPTHIQTSIVDCCFSLSKDWISPSLHCAPDNNSQLTRTD